MVVSGDVLRRLWGHPVGLCQFVSSWFVHCRGMMFFLIASFNLKLWEHRVTKAERDSTVSCHRRQEKALIYSPAVFPPFRYLHCTRHRPREVFVSLIFSLSEGHPRIRSCYWSASEPICCQKHLACSLSVFLGEEKHEGALISFRCPCEAEGEVENENKLDVKRERERAKADCQRVGGSISWFEENLTTEDRRLRQCLLCACLTCY